MMAGFQEQTPRRGILMIQSEKPINVFPILVWKQVQSSALIQVTPRRATRPRAARSKGLEPHTATETEARLEEAE